MDVAVTATLIVGCILAAALAFLLGRFALRMPPPPTWTWDDLRKLVALAATVVAAGVLTAWGWWQTDAQTALLVRIVEALADGTQSEPLGRIGVQIATTEGDKGKLLVIGLLLIILSLGLVIGPRLFRFKAPGGAEGEFGGGDQEKVEAARRVEEAATAEREQIESEAKP